MSPSRIGKYATLGELGSGAGSHVYHVLRESDSEEYALKVIGVACRRDLKYLDQLEHEFRIGQYFDHPNLIKVHALEIDRSWLFRPTQGRLLLEYAAGQPMNRTPPLRYGRLMRVFERVASGLAHMHGHGVCHADLKPDNLILGPGTAVKIIDFGLAWVDGEKKNRVQGTPEFMAPETLAHRVINPHTDVFNLGATLYRLTTFQCLPVSPAGLLLDRKSFARTIVPVGRLNAAVPAELCELIHWCIEYNPDYRPRDANELREALAQLAREWEIRHSEPR